jgi:predicted nucleic acid-binding protein
VRLWPIEQNIAFEYGKLYLVLKSRGKVLSHVDILLAALAKMKKLTLLTTDKDFQALPEIPTENWLE